jgi:prepilin-type N-terminal cleavage/methylation domain-containing protein
MQTFKHRHGAIRNPENGFTLIEMLIAALILLTGLTAGMMLIITAMANDNRSKNDTSATVLTQMTIETIAAVPANATTSMTILDCNPTTSSASHTINTGVSTVGSSAGAPLSGGAIDFTQATVNSYSMTYYGCQASTGDRQTLYDVRWNVKTLSADAKLVTVAARPIVGNTHANFLAVPVTLKMIVGL